jgi:hypothetical protein
MDSGLKSLARQAIPMSADLLQNLERVAAIGDLVQSHRAFAAPICSLICSGESPKFRSGRLRYHRSGPRTVFGWALFSAASDALPASPSLSLFCPPAVASAVSARMSSSLSEPPATRLFAKTTHLIWRYCCPRLHQHRSPSAAPASAGRSVPTCFAGSVVSGAPRPAFVRVSAQSARNPRRRNGRVVIQAMEAGSCQASWDERLQRTRELLAEVGMADDFTSRVEAN